MTSCCPLSEHVTCPLCYLHRLLCRIPPTPPSCACFTVVAIRRVARPPARMKALWVRQIPLLALLLQILPRLPLGLKCPLLTIKSQFPPSCAGLCLPHRPLSAPSPPWTGLADLFSVPERATLSLVSQLFSYYSLCLDPVSPFSLLAWPRQPSARGTGVLLS